MPATKTIGGKRYTLIDSRLDRRESERVAKVYRGYGALVKMVEQHCSIPSGSGSVNSNWHIYVAEGKGWPLRHP
jgi:hypothetical protein